MAEDHPADNETLLLASVRQDPRIFGQVYQLYVERVFKYLFSRTGNVQEAEDITAQTFLTAFERFQQYRQDGHFAAWLFAIARNKTTDAFRRDRHNLPIEDAETIPAAGDPLGEVIRSEQAAVLAGLIRALPEDERELLRLRFLAEMSFAEMARLLGRNEDTVKKSLYRLLARLQSQVEVSYDR